ncbi:MAG: glycosyl hydrolase family 28 protein, partial [Brevundimonas sp.]
MHRRSLLQLGLTGAIATAAPPAFAQTMGRTFDAADFGAVGDGVAINTRPIQAAIDAAAGAGGGTVVLKPGVYLSGSLFVKSNVTLLIGRGATVKGLRDIAAYPMVRTRVAGIEMEWPAGLLNIYREKNAKITGEGLVDGDGKVFWDSYWAMRRDYDPKDLRWAADYDCRRPRLIHVYDAEAVEVSGLNLARSGFWTVHVCYSRDVKVLDLIIRNNLGGRGPSTDGIDIDSSERVLVER